MTRAALAVVIVAMLNACATPGLRRGLPTAAMAVGTPLVVAGLYMLMFGYLTFPADDCATTSSCDDGPALRRNGAIFTGAGGVFMLAGFLGHVHAAHEEQREGDEQDAARARSRRELAWTLIDQAKAAERRGDCESVRNLGPQVAKLDVVIHTKYFLRDSPLDHCLHAAAPPSPSEVASLVPPRDPIKDREQAFALTAKAREAARAGDCAKTLELQREVRELDLDVHDAWFVRDDAIKICIAPTAPAAQP